MSLSSGKNTGSKSKKTSRRPVQKRRFWPGLAIVAAVILILTASSFTYAANMEENDSFCASCHTQPESTFYSRSQAGRPTDLASFHQTKRTKCIDCHSGSGTTGRVSAMLLGARNAVAYFTHTAVQPAPLTVPIRDESCSKCHADTLTRNDFNNHFHIFLPRWQAADPKAAVCVDCHVSHSTKGEAQIGYLERTTTEQICQNCHDSLGAGD